MTPGGCSSSSRPERCGSSDLVTGQLLPVPFLTANVDANGERGLLGLAFDPD